MEKFGKNFGQNRLIRERIGLNQPISFLSKEWCSLKFKEEAGTPNSKNKKKASNLEA